MISATKHIHRPVLRLLMALLAVFCVFIFTGEARAGCAPGVPCIVNATPNNPADPNDGPTAPGAPNRVNVNPTNAACTGATPAPGCACDADLMNQIYSRAFLESQRDTIKAEVLIRKPDSILEYTCFNQLANLAARRGGPLFSESNDWQFRTVEITSNWLGMGWIVDSPIPLVLVNTFMGPNKLQNSIENLVLDSLSEYIGDNFSHRFLGGAASSLDYTAGGGNSYNCTYMDRVYFLAKCADMVTDDRFWRFSELINPDPRLLPQTCPNPNTQITQQRIDMANNQNFQYVNFDRVVSYNNLLPPGAPCADPVPTGVTVTIHERNVDADGNVSITDTDTFPDMVCPDPNCRYNPGGTGGGVPSCAP